MNNKLFKNNPTECDVDAVELLVGKKKIKDECKIECTNNLKRKMSRVPRKKISDIYDSGSDFDESDSLSERKKSKKYDSDPDFNDLNSVSERTESCISGKILAKRKKTDFIGKQPEVSKLPSSSKLEESVFELASFKAEKPGPKKSVKKISDKLKRMIVDSIEAGVCNRQTASTVFNVPYSTVVHIYKKFLETGEVENHNRDNKLIDEHVKFLADTLAQNCTYTIKELTAMVSSKYSIEISNASVSKKLAAFHFNLNRVQEMPKIDVTQEIIADHKEYCQNFLELQNSGRHIVYFDETEFKVLMRRFYGRLDPGVKGQVTAPSMRTRHRTIMASMTKDELFYYRSLEDPRKRGDLFDYMKELFRLLSKKNKSDVVIVMGTSALNYIAELKTMAQVEGHEVVMLPVYNKWFNPVESLFSQWATIIRATKPDNEKQMELIINSFAGLITNKQCHNYCLEAITKVTQCVAGTLKYDD